MSLPPCCPYHPAEVTCRLGQSAPMSCCLRPIIEGSAFGLFFLSRPLLGSPTLRPGDSLTIPRMALSVGFIRFVSSTNATQATGSLTLSPVGLSPTEHASFSLDALWAKYTRDVAARGPRRSMCWRLS